LARAYDVLELCILSRHSIVPLPVLPYTHSEINQHRLPATSTGAVRAAVLKEKLWRNSNFKGGLILLDQFGLRTLE